jgi:hypothetical protein
MVKGSEGNVMTLKRRGQLSKIGVLAMAIGFGMLLGGLLGGCGDGSSFAGSESTGPVDVPLLDKEQPGEVQTASFALG